MPTPWQDYRVHRVEDGVFVLYSRPRGRSVSWQPVDAVEADSVEQARDYFVGRAVSGIAGAELMEG